MAGVTRAFGSDRVMNLYNALSLYPYWAIPNSNGCRLPIVADPRPPWSTASIHRAQLDLYGSRVKLPSVSDWLETHHLFQLIQSAFHRAQSIVNIHLPSV